MPFARRDARALVLALVVTLAVGAPTAMAAAPTAHAPVPVPAPGLGPGTPGLVAGSPTGVDRAPAPIDRAAVRAALHPSGAPSGVAVDGAVGPGILGTGHFPYGGAFDPRTDELYIADQAGNNVTVLNASSGASVASIDLSSDPLTATYVPSNGEVYVSVEGTHELAVVDPSNHTVVSTIDLAGDPEYTAYDPDDATLYLSEWTSVSSALGVQRVYTSNDTAAPVVRTGFDDPLDLTVDTLNDTVWVMNLGSDRISVLAASNDTVVRSIAPGPMPSGSDLQGGIVYSTVGDQVFVDNDGKPGVVNVFDAANYSLLRTGLPVGAYAYGASLTYDPASERVYVGSYFEDTVSVLGVVNDSVAAPPLDISGGPWVGIFDNASGALFFLLSGANATAWIFGGIAVNATETGLPPGAAWSVTLDGRTANGTASTLPFVLPVGTFSYEVQVPAGFAATTPAGSVTVPTSPVLARTLPIAVGAVYPVVVSEQGLPAGAPWNVTVGNATGNGTAGTAIDLLEPNGSYPYAVATAEPGFTGGFDSAGRLTVNGGPVHRTATFVASTYTVAFQETGLPPGTGWTVTLGGVAEPANTPAIDFVEPNGMYAWSVGTVPGFVTTNLSGELRVDGANRTVNVTFLEVTYAVQFVESGLPGGTNWSVSLGTASASSTQATITVHAPNGTYVYRVGNVAAFAAHPSSGTLVLAGAALSVSITFAPSSSGGTISSSGGGAGFLGLSAEAGYALLGGIVAIAVAVAALFAMRGRRGAG